MMILIILRVFLAIFVFMRMGREHGHFLVLMIYVYYLARMGNKICSGYTELYQLYLLSVYFQNEIRHAFRPADTELYQF